LAGFRKNSFIVAVFASLIMAVLICSPASAASPLVRKISTESTETKFTLKVLLNMRLAPKVFALDVKGGNPRVVVDFVRASGVKGLPARMKTTSPMVRSVRVGIHKKPKPKIRLVLDLVPGFIYQVDQWFRRDKNTYILVLSAK